MYGRNEQIFTFEILGDNSFDRGGVSFQLRDW